MSKSKEMPKKKTRRGNLTSNKMRVKPLITYRVGVYFPERDPLDFEVIAHDFEMSKGSVHFYLLEEMALKTFVATFTHVAYIVIKHIEKKDHVDLPERFGEVT